MSDEKVSEGVALLLRRMETNPEEFSESPLRGGKWSYIVNAIEARINGHQAQSWMSDYEVQILWETYCRVKQKEFHEGVMRKLLVEESMGIAIPDLSYFMTRPELAVHCATPKPEYSIKDKLKAALGLK
jgi:hypothetical protein